MLPAVDGKQTFEASLLKTEGHATTPRKKVYECILRHFTSSLGETPRRFATLKMVARLVFLRLQT